MLQSATTKNKMSKNTAVATKLTIPDTITEEWLSKHVTEETFSSFRKIRACYGPTSARNYLQRAIDEGNVVVTTKEEKLTPTPTKPKTIKSKVKKVLGLKEA